MTTLLFKIAHSAFTGTTMCVEEPSATNTMVLLSNNSLKTVLLNRITTYSKISVSAQYAEVVNHYPDL